MCFFCFSLALELNNIAAKSTHTPRKLLAVSATAFSRWLSRARRWIARLRSKLNMHLECPTEKCAFSDGKLQAVYWLKPPQYIANVARECRAFQTPTAAHTQQRQRQQQQQLQQEHSGNSGEEKMCRRTNLSTDVGQQQRYTDCWEE